MPSQDELAGCNLVSHSRYSFSHTLDGQATIGRQATSTGAWQVRAHNRKVMCKQRLYFSPKPTAIWETME
jgi:hypothetical protein